MPRALATDSLSSEAQRLMVACFRSRMPAAAIAEKIKAETGEVAAERTIGRRKAEWEAEQSRRQAAREQMEDLLEAMRSGDRTASEMVNALALDALMRDPARLTDADPIALQQTSIQAERVRLQREQVAIKKRQIELDEKKFEAMQQREKKAIETATALEQKAASGQTVTPEEIRKIREVYGLEPGEAA